MFSCGPVGPHRHFAGPCRRRLCRGLRARILSFSSSLSVCSRSALNGHTDDDEDDEDDDADDDDDDRGRPLPRIGCCSCCVELR